MPSLAARSGCCKGSRRRRAACQNRTLKTCAAILPDQAGDQANSKEDCSIRGRAFQQRGQVSDIIVRNYVETDAEFLRDSVGVPARRILLLTKYLCAVLRA